MLQRSFACLTIVLTLGSLAACGDDESPAAADGGADAGKDSGLTWNPDSGAKSDASMDASVRACAETREALPSVVLPRCTAKTRDCVVACESAADANECRSACVKADTHKPSPLAATLDCEACVYLQLFACADQNGCHAPTAETFCCLEDKCGAGSAPGCADTMCGDVLTDSLECAYNAAPDCLDYTKGFIVDCFETGDDDGGVEDAGE